MPLQSSGQISINDIRNELGTSNSSLGQLSNSVGFGAPHAISEFYGYNNCPAAYTVVTQNCFGCDYITTYNDGNCGTFNEVIYNASQCGCGQAYSCADFYGSCALYPAPCWQYGLNECGGGGPSIQ